MNFLNMLINLFCKLVSSENITPYNILIYCIDGYIVTKNPL